MAGSAFADIFGTRESLGIPKNDPLESYLQDVWKQPFRCKEILLVFHKTVEAIQRSQTSAQDDSSNKVSFMKKYNYLYYAHLVPHKRFVDALSLLIYVTGLRAFGLRDTRNYLIQGLPSHADNAQETLRAVLAALEDVGLGGEDMEQAWAVAMDKLIDREVARQSAQRPSSGSYHDSIAGKMKDAFLPWMYRMRDQQESHQDFYGASSSPLETALHPVEDLLKSVSIDKMGRSKARDLCNSIINGGPQISKEDEAFLDTYTTSVSSRNDIAAYFERQLQSRVLHSGLSTIRILQIYMRIILSFRKLDRSGIILRRLASPIQSFLRTRTDAVHIILSSLLEDARDADSQLKPSTETFCSEIAACMEDETVKDFREYHEGKDLTDEDWMPEPIDAATGHQATRNLDAIAHLVTISPRQAFVTELQTVLATRLLHRTTSSFSHELRLLNLFKQRFEEFHIQSCEIMVRDVLSSQNVDSDIRNQLATHSSSNQNDPVDFHAMVLSKFYWPALNPATFTIPPAITAQAQTYASYFRRLKKRRKLEFLSGLGRATVNLTFADRTLEIECAPYQAALIHHFDGDNARHSPADLRAALNMDDKLVHQALNFWVAQSVLTHAHHPRNAHDEKIYTPLERLPHLPTSAPSPPPTTDATPPVKTPADLLTENRDLYARVVEGMLTNQGAMPTARILAMMKMVLPAGFPFSEEELNTRVLGEMERRGRVGRGEDGVWRMKR